MAPRRNAMRLINGKERQIILAVKRLESGLEAACIARSSEE